MPNEYSEIRCNRCMSLIDSNNATCPECGYDIAEANESDVGASTGKLLNSRYYVGNVIGTDKFGTKYIAYDTVMDNKVVIKCVISKKQVNQFSEALEIRDVFLEKVRERILSVHNFDSFIGYTEAFFDDDEFYLVSNYYDGMTLKQYLSENNGVLSVAKAMNIISKIAVPLHEMHVLNVAHGCISPESIIISGKNYRLLDSDMIAGIYADNPSSFLRPNYTAAECYEPDAEPTAVSDVYSLAAVLYTMLTGIKIPSAVDREYGEEVIPFDELDVKLPPLIEAAIMRALELYSEDRVQSVDGFFAMMKGEGIMSDPDDEDTQESLVEKRKMEVHRTALEKSIKADAASAEAKVKKRKQVTAIPTAVKVTVISITAVLLIIVALLILGVFDKIFKSNNKQYVAVPDIQSMTITDASAKLSELGLRMLVIGAEKSAIPAGSVYAQTPIARSSTEKGDAVCVTVSCGNTNYARGTVPNVTYMSFTSAFDILSDDYGYIVKVNFREDVATMVGCVLGQDVAAGTSLNSGDTITLTVSSGNAEQRTITSFSKNIAYLPSTVVFINGEVVYDVASTRNRTVLPTMPAAPVPTDINFQFVGWSYAQNGLGGEFSSNSECSDLFCVYAYFAESGAVIPTIAPAPSISPSYTTFFTPQPLYTPFVYPTTSPEVTSLPISPSATIVAPTPTITPSATPTVTVTPTKTPAPTHTVAPTSTPAPTPTPIVHVTDIELYPSIISITVGEDYQLNAKVIPSDATDKTLIWRSDDTSVATVSSSGRVTAVGYGVTKIYVLSRDNILAEESCYVEVNLPSNELTVPTQPTSMYKIATESLA